MSHAQHLDDAIHALTSAAAQGKSLLPLFKRLCPHIHRQIADDRKDPGLFPLWGKSVNVDENAGQVIVPPPILQTIGRIAGVPMRGRFVHAGLQHTYGYLFSPLETPYGKKRDRWVSTDLERGFGLDPSLLGPQPRSGTLLANATYFLAHIAFRGAERALAALQRLRPARQLRDYDYASLAWQRVREEMPLGQDRLLVITDLIRFPRPPRSARANRHLLIYSLRRARSGRARLITAFTVNQTAVEALLDPARFADRTAITLKFNAYVRGLFARTLLGRRSLEEIRTESPPDTRNRTRRSLPGT